MITTDSTQAGGAAAPERFERTLSRAPFEGLKAILDNLSPERERLQKAVQIASSFQDLLSRLGYKLTITRQIHVQDCYSRLGRAGGIKVVLPYHDIPTQSSLPTLVNFDSTVTATEKSAAFFETLLLNLKKQLAATG